MKIKIISEPPVDASHGVVRGRVFEVLAKKPALGKQSAGYWIMGDTGRQVLVLWNECKEHEEAEAEESN